MIDWDEVYPSVMKQVAQYFGFKHNHNITLNNAIRNNPRSISNKYDLEYAFHDIDDGDHQIIHVTLSWNVERLIWIGYSKNNETNDYNCYLPSLPKDILSHILRFIK